MSQTQNPDTVRAFIFLSLPPPCLWLLLPFHSHLRFCPFIIWTSFHAILPIHRYMLFHLPSEPTLSPWLPDPFIIMLLQCESEQL